MPGVYDRKDRFYREAKDQGYRSRAAFKLMELDAKHRFLSKGKVVLDLGCFPGGWLQVAAEKVGAEGKVFGIDLLDVARFEGVGAPSGERKVLNCPVVLKGDITDEAVLAQIVEVVGERGVDLVLSDMSPKLSGVKFRDAADSVMLAERAFEVAGRLLKPGGSFVCKLFPGEEEKQFAKLISPSFTQVARSHLKATRKTSTELYIVGTKFKGR